jgi:ATP-dependent Clp protease ATP-binding subunit ClpA
MFERYTEKARRAIFFARYESSQAGSPVIATEHLLFGVLRASRNLQEHLRVDPAELEKRLWTGVVGAKISTSVDIPLDDLCKRALAHAAQEADRMRDRHIDTEHLLLGLMREDKSHAAQVLRDMGAPNVDEVRKAIASAPPTSEADPSHSARTVPGVPAVILVDEETGREYSAGPRFRGTPRIGEAIVVAARGTSERFRVIDVQWKLMEGAQPNELVLNGLEVRIRREEPSPIKAE